MDLLDNPFFDFALSVGILSCLLCVRNEITPDVMHFVSCFINDDVNIIWVMFLWFIRKCFLTMDKNYKHLTP